MGGAWETPTRGCDVFLAVPSLSGGVTLKWSLSQFDLGRSLGATRVTPGSWEGMPVDKARNMLVKDAQEAGARWIWFVDSDVLVPPGALFYMMQWRLPILSALVYGKKNDGPALWRLDPASTSYVPMRHFPNPGLVEVDAIPMGCCLIDMRVFDHMPFPWFDWEVLDPRLDAGSGRLSEDFYFCREAAKANFRIFCYTGIRCGHEHVQIKGPDGGVLQKPSLQ